jgi:predicted alpha/beta-fold hydrolase
MGKNLQKLAKRHYKSLLRHANPVVIEACEKVVALKDPTIEEFDDILTVVAGGPAPRWPYATAEDYYQDNSASKLLGQIRFVLFHRSFQVLSNESVGCLSLGSMLRMILL